MRNVVLKATAVFAVACGFIMLNSACETTGPSEFGHAELIYELVSDDMYNITLADASAYGDMYLLRTYDYGTKERGLWYVEPADGEPILIGEDTASWWGTPKLSPDKENVVFNEKSGIYVIPLAGGEPRQIYGRGLQPTPTQWIDDETVLMFVLEDGWNINTVNVNTLEVNTLLSITRNGYPVTRVYSTYLSSDDRYLFVNGKDQEGDEWGPYSYFFRIYDTETWKYDEYILGENGIDYSADGPWSPDGTKLAIFTGPGTHIGYFDLATEDDVMVFRSDKLILEWYYGLIWTPDSRKVLASEDRDDNILRVFAVDVE